MSEQRQHEKEEKLEKQEEKDEKEREKQEKEGLTLDEKVRRDPLSAIIWAGILIWAGLVLVAQNLNLLAGLGGEAWPLILLGAGLIVLVEAVVRLNVPAYRRPVGGTLILGLVLVAIGLGNLLNLESAWPIILIIIGVGLLLRTLIRRREE
jgi:hypothetical protein